MNCGDTVKIINKNSTYNGMEGEIVEIILENHIALIKLKNGETLWESKDKLEKVI